MTNKIIEKCKESIRYGQGTLAIIFINLVLFIALNTIPEQADKLLLNPEISFMIERPWTLVTVFFSHEVHFHFLFNMGLFFVFGLELEKITSTKVVLMVYLIAGFIGSLAIFPVSYLIGFEELVVGASAAAWGVVSTFAAMRPNVIIGGSKARNWPVVLFIANAILAILNPQISVGAGAHAVGIVMGLILGYWLKLKEINQNMAIK